MDAAELRDDDLHEKRMARLKREADWKRDVLSLLEDVITADQKVDHNNTMQDTRRDGPFARRARELVKRANTATI